MKTIEKTKPSGRVNGSGPWVHNKGVKGDRDRAVLLHSYREMCREFRIPKDRRLTPRDLVLMSNDALYRVNKDLYNGATVKQARRLAERLGVASRGPSLFARLTAWLGKKIRGLRIDSQQEKAHA